MPGDGKDLLPSLFTTQIAAHLHPTSSEFVTHIQEQTHTALETILTTPEHTLLNKSKQEIEFFTQLVGEFKLSVTALNSYLKNPEEFLLNSLLRIPKVATPSLCFGTAVHFALEQFYRKLQEHTLLSYEELAAFFEQKLSQELLTPLDFTDRLQHGKEILAFYYNEVLAKTDSTQVLFIERFFGGSLTPVSLFDNEVEIKLSGRIDRVDVINAAEKTVKIVDYKTGKSKSKNVLLGQTSLSDYSQRELELPETIRGRLQRQMVFYKLLCELDPSFTYTLAEVEFDFIEPTGTHKESHVAHVFTVSDQAVLDLKALIIEVMREIRTLQFFDKN